MTDDTNEDDPGWLVTEDETDWTDTDHARVYDRDGGSAQRTVDSGKEVAEKFPEATIVVSDGPYRGYDVKWELKDDRIALDFYSVNPGYSRIDSVIEDIRAAIRLPDEEDDRGMQPFTVGGKDWVKKAGDELEAGDRLPGDDGSVFAVTVVREVDDTGGPDEFIAGLLAERFNAPWGEPIDVFDPDGKFKHDEMNSPEDWAQLMDVVHVAADEFIWTLQPSEPADEAEVGEPEDEA